MQRDEVIEQLLALFIFPIIILVSFAAATPQNTLKAQVWYWAAEYFYAAGNYQETEHYAMQALPLLKKGHDETTLADCLNVLAINHVRMGHYTDAIDYANESLTVSPQDFSCHRVDSSKLHSDDSHG